MVILTIKTINFPSYFYHPSTMRLIFPSPPVPLRHNGYWLKVSSSPIWRNETPSNASFPSNVRISCIFISELISGFLRNRCVLILFFLVLYKRKKWHNRKLIIHKTERPMALPNLQNFLRVSNAHRDCNWKSGKWRTNCEWNMWSKATLEIICNDMVPRFFHILLLLLQAFPALCINHIRNIAHRNLHVSCV